MEKGKARSNIVDNFASCTIPRHLRDIVITEYGIADLRSKTDEEVVKALINIADSRFQSDLLRSAKAAGKLAADYQIPAAYRENSAARIHRDVAWAQSRKMMPSYPFGCDFSDDELRAAKALKTLASLPWWQTILLALKPEHRSDAARKVLLCLGLNTVSGLKDRLLQRLISAVMKRESTF
jgi:hypothetical protein